MSLLVWKTRHLPFKSDTLKQTLVISFGENIHQYSSYNSKEFDESNARNILIGDIIGEPNQNSKVQDWMPTSDRIYVNNHGGICINNYSGYYSVINSLSSWQCMMG